MPVFSPEDYATATEEEKLLADIFDAKERGDEHLAWELMRKVDFPAEALMAAKMANGADWIKQKGLRTHTAEAKYGRNWLNG